MGSSKTYEAFIIRKKLEGKNFPTIDEVVQDKILASDAKLKKEEIDEAVCKEIEKNMGVRIYLDESISGKTSLA